jgi:3-methyladenine DNA glycosylase AlkD
MNKAQVMDLLKANKNDRGIEYWARSGLYKIKLKSFGIGLTVLRKLARQIGKDRKLALELWQSDVYDARIIALLIDDPKYITREQAEAQVGELEQGYLAHVFSSCDATLAKTAFVVELADDWVHSKDQMRRQCGYGLLYEISKSRKKNAPEDAFFLKHIERIHKRFSKEESPVLLAMGAALMGMGKRNRKLNAAALKVAKNIGPIEFETAEGSKCDPFDVVKHLNNPWLNQKLGK